MTQRSRGVTLKAGGTIEHHSWPGWWQLDQAGENSKCDVLGCIYSVYVNLFLVGVKGVVCMVIVSCVVIDVSYVVVWRLKL